MPNAIDLPLDLMSDTVLDEQPSAGLRMEVRVPDDYETLLASASGHSEVLGIQRLLTLARRGTLLRVVWQPAIAKKATKSSSIYPLLAVLLLLQAVEHWVVQDSGQLSVLAVDTARKAIFRHRLAKDLFSDSDVVVSADSLGEGLPPDLYDPRSRMLRSREDFETLVVEALSAQRPRSYDDAIAFASAGALGVIVAELFENTDIHAKLDLDTNPLRPDSVRGVILKRVSIDLPALQTSPKGSGPRNIDCFEVSVFDSGVGYYSSYTGNKLDPQVSLMDEWKVLHNCLVRHYHPDIMDRRAGHRAMGLYEVLRAIQSLKGRIEIRTGRLYAYRTFLDGQLQAQMEPRAQFAYRAWPKPKLLDVEKRYLALPSAQALLVGSSVRVIVPLI